mmetsp:Transcript_5861/g.8437  ORF Transcript_5861/g.8437 Transcript_5861/m.8437 type:complete len:202 (+) Transcript_5861:61-666(+)
MAPLSRSVHFSSSVAPFPSPARNKHLKPALKKNGGEEKICPELTSSGTETTVESSCNLQQHSFNSSSSSVSFSCVEIREYDLTLGDHPSCSYGPPISLDWKYKVSCNLDIDEYELHRSPRRSLREMLLNYYCRKNLLLCCGDHSERELKNATKEVNRVKMRRSVTKAFLPARKLEEVVESAGRKMRRVVIKEEKERRSFQI